jgi:hypothetical protein
MIDTAIRYFEPPGAEPEFPSLPPAFENRRHFRDALKAHAENARSLIEIAEARCGRTFSSSVDPLRTILHEVLPSPPAPSDEQHIARVRRIAELIENAAKLTFPAGIDGAPETMVDIGTELFVKAICCFRANQGWKVHYSCDGWRKAVEAAQRERGTDEIPNDRMHASMPNETSGMIAFCLSTWGFRADPAVIAKALKQYEAEIKGRGYGPRIDDFDTPAPVFRTPEIKENSAS